MSSEKTSPLELDAFTKEILEAYRGWDAYEREYGKPDVIDWNLAPPTEARTWSSRKEILEFFTEAADYVPTRTQDHDFVKAKLVASVAYLRACLGEQQPFREFIEQTLGITPELSPETEIETSAAGLEEKLDQYGIKF